MDEIKELEIRYENKEIEKLRYIDGKSDWIDLRAAEHVIMKKGDHRLISLGVAIRLPEGWEAHIVPRGSTLRNFGVIQGNHMGIVDVTYCGNEDIWKFSALAIRDTEININDRICQFRIMKNQPKIVFHEVESLDGENRGSFGSTGKQ